ncbi:carboxypeptidase-like regulatory domain-containing protein [Flavobacterium sp. ZB4R12]|uniref:carboxypeptidase-like regulatory domain-containing protein n=1 Tax=Flavobacterium sp. ZB4R12 TaxID=3398732 RepID=UPI003AB035CB
MGKCIQKKYIPLSKWTSFFGLFTHKSGTLLCLFIILLASLHSSASAQELDCDEVLVSLQVKYIGSTELPSIICGEEVYLSVPDVFDFLKIKNTTNANYSTIEGFFINQKNNFKIDEITNQIMYKEQAIRLKPGDLIRTPTNLFLKASYFNTVFELENNFSFRSLTVSMSSKLELPAIREARIAQLRANINKIKNEFTADTTLGRDKPLFHFGTANWAVDANQQANGTHSERLLLNLGGMLAGGELTSAFNYGSNQPFILKNQYYRWRYVNDDNKYISQITLGKIGASSTATILYPVVGGQITNAPTQIRKSFGTYALSDHTQPDWMVELYINNVLVDYIKADANGFFSFNVPLMYGRTEISLRYYGPWGEEQVSGKQFVIPFNFLPKKELEYILSSGIIEDGKNSTFANAKVNYGLSNYITLGGGVEYVSSLKNNKIIPFFNSSVRVSSQLFISGGYYYKVMYNGILNYTAPNNLRLELDYTKYDKNQQSIRFNYSEMRKANLSFPIHTAHFSGNSRLSLQQNLFNTNKYTTAELLLSGTGYGLNFNFTTNSFFTDSNKPLLYSNLSTSLRLPKGFVLIPQVRYEYNADGITSLRVELKKQVFKKGYVQASFDRNFKTNSSYLQMGFRYDFETISTGFSSSFTKNQASFSQSASGSLIYEPKADFIDFNNKTSVGRASIKFIPFLDTNGNGKRDPNEPPVIGMQILLNGGGRQINSKDGTTIITGLEPYIKNHVELNTNSINTIAWRVINKTLNITLNPNQLKIIEIPVVVVGEVGGTVNRNENGRLIGTGGLKINIYDIDNVLTTTILSEPDGYFSFLGLKSGRYSAKIDSLQLQKLQMKAEPANAPFEIDNGADGAIVDNIEFVLHKGKIKKSDTETIPLHNPSKTAVVAVSEIATDPIEYGEQVVYSVQLLSSKTQLPLNHPWFKNKKEIVEYEHHGVYKYTWGSSTSRSKANKIKNRLRSEGYHDAFVVPFHKNKRISRQEAKAIDKKNAAIQFAATSPKSQSGIFNSPTSVIDASREEQYESSPEEGLIFKTQLLASKKKVALSDSFFKGLKDVKEYLHKGLYKYTIGTNKSMTEANKNKNKLRSQGFSGAFVVPFNDNKRISTQEAKIIIKKKTIVPLVTVPQELQPEISIPYTPIAIASTPEQYKSSPEEGLIFKTQLLASKKKLALTDPIFKGLKGIKEYLHKKWYKYTMGISKSLKKANEIKNKLRSQGFFGTFVVPFYHNKRTSIQEAEAINKKNAADLLEAAFQKSQLDLSKPNTSVTNASTEDQYGNSLEEGLIFKNQLLASKKKVALSDPIFKGLKGVKEYRHKGMYKYTTGTSKSIAEANEIRNKLRYQGFSNAFVVPFYNDERINSGKISGVVFYKAENLDGIAGIRVLIYDSNNTITTATLSEVDGTFTVLGLKPGDYTAQLDSEQLDKAQMIPTAPVQKFSIANDNGNVEAKLKFILEAKDNKNQQPDEKSTGNKITSQKGLVFKVQIMASKHRKSFSNPLFKVLKGIEMYQHEGWYKYTWGEANTLEEIRKIKRDLQNRGFKNAFIVPFYNELRMSLQEATGEVSLKMNGDLYELGGIKINIYDDNNVFITSLLSKSDGHFSFLGLRPGNYKAELDPIQLDYLKMISDTDAMKFSIGNNVDGDVPKQLNFILQQKITNPK